MLLHSLTNVLRFPEKLCVCSQRAQKVLRFSGERRTLVRERKSTDLLLFSHLIFVFAPNLSTQGGGLVFFKCLCH